MRRSGKTPRAEDESPPGPSSTSGSTPSPRREPGTSRRRAGTSTLLNSWAAISWRRSHPEKPIWGHHGQLPGRSRRGRRRPLCPRHRSAARGRRLLTGPGSASPWWRTGPDRPVRQPSRPLVLGAALLGLAGPDHAPGSAVPAQRPAVIHRSTPPVPDFGLACLHRTWGYPAPRSVRPASNPQLLEDVLIDFKGLPVIGAPSGHPDQVAPDPVHAQVGRTSTSPTRPTWPGTSTPPWSPSWIPHAASGVSSTPPTTPSCPWSAPARRGRPRPPALPRGYSYAFMGGTAMRLLQLA